MKKIDLIYSKITTKVVETALIDPATFYGCKTNEDVFLSLGSQAWEDVLYELGYSPRFYIGEVQNRSNRFLNLFDKVVAMCDEEFPETIIAVVNNGKNK